MDDYFENEDKYRSEQFSEIEEYFLNKKNLEDNLKKELEKYYFSNIFIENNNTLNIPELQQILFKDYILYYLSKSNTYFSNKNILLFFSQFFKLFLSREENVNLENEYEKEDIYSLENISKFILFIESYKYYIYSLCKFICSIDSYINNFIKDFTQYFSSKIFKVHNQKISYVNDIFFNLFESTIYCIINTNISFNEFSDEDLDDFLKEIKLFSDIMMNANIELRLALKQILYILDFIQVKEYLNNSGINLKENLQKYLKILKKEDDLYLMPQFLNDENINYEEDIINEEFSFLKQTITQEKKYLELISKLLDNKLKISKEENYKIKILKIILSNNLFIIRNKIIFENILSKYDICPINQDNNNDEINQLEEIEFDSDGIGEIFLSQINEDENNFIIKFLNENSNTCLDEILLSIFDGKFTNYFESKKNKEDLILNQSFEIFQKCVNYIENNNCKLKEIID